VRWWTTRAKVYADTADSQFVGALLDGLRARGVSHVRLGDAVWGLPGAAGLREGMTATTTHLMTFDATVSDGEALARMDPKIRTQVRRAQREGVVVEEIDDPVRLESFCGLVDETNERLRARDVVAAIPRAYFRAVFSEMVPRGQATFLLARVGARVLAGGLFLMSRTRMSYYLGGSTRDRALTGLQGPTALFWHAMRLAHAREIPSFDLGAATPTDDPAHPNYSVYRFKRAFGGRMEELRGAEVQLSRIKCHFQDRVVFPAWKLLYPWYLTLTARAAA
jgi:lipid II:glycine glycyltransferase (peptidoglycan interpeptide bridge formation enzyme)